MKILFTGGGSGGHFYPLIAVAEEINRIVKEEKLLEVQMYYMSDSPHDPDMLLENNIAFIQISAGKMRRYFSLSNIADFFKTISGTLSAMVKVFNLYPDVIFSKGAYASFPVLIAARFFRIPVFVHESDSVPGRANMWAGKFAVRVAVSYPDAAKFFKADRVAVTGNPVRKSILTVQTAAVAKQFLNLIDDVPVVLILGGSLGAQLINDQIIEILPQLVEKYYVIHQIGKNNMREVLGTASVALDDSPNKNRYRPFDYLDDLNMVMAAGAANLIVSRAGSAIFEIAHWGIPSILIPIADSNGDHQRQNAFYYSETGAATVIEENNLSPHILLAEINRIIENKDIVAKMSAGAKSFIQTNAAELIAREILRIGLAHE